MLIQKRENAASSINIQQLFMEPGIWAEVCCQKALYATSTILILCRKEKNISTKGKKKSSTRQESPPQLRPARTDGAAPPARSHHHRKDGAGQTGNGAMREEQEDCTIQPAAATTHDAHQRLPDTIRAFADDAERALAVVIIAPPPTTTPRVGAFGPSWFASRLGVPAKTTGIKRDLEGKREVG
jgi:hypothetical protein